MLFTVLFHELSFTVNEIDLASYADDTPLKGVLQIYPTLKIKMQYFLSTKIIKYIRILLLNEYNFDNYLFLPLMTFLVEIIELYLQ